MKIYGHPTSGNVYKPQLLLALTGREASIDPIKWGTPEIASPSFLALNPAGRVPVLRDGDFVLPESNAQLWYLAQGTSFWPSAIEDQAQVLRWLFWEQYSHEPYIAVIRYLLHYGEPGAETQRKIQERQEGAKAALDLLENHLTQQDWLVGANCTIADLALYAYTHVADEAGFCLDHFPALQDWIARIEALPGWIALADYGA